MENPPRLEFIQIYYLPPQPQCFSLVHLQSAQQQFPLADADTKHSAIKDAAQNRVNAFINILLLSYFFDSHLK